MKPMGKKNRISEYFEGKSFAHWQWIILTDTGIE